MSRVWVVGSINADTVLRVEHLPAAGETRPGELSRGLGGKGANQAVAAARAGGQVVFVGAVGDDQAGASARVALAAEGIDIERVRIRPGPTGSAFVMVDRSGENAIVVVAGANATVDPEDARDLPFSAGDVVLVQGELALETSAAAMAAARAASAVTIWNPAPADATVRQHLESVDVIVVNEGELADLVGDGPVADGLAELHRLGAGRAVVTRGARGLVAWRDGGTVVLPAMAVTAVDTTGAGDCFVGVLAARLSLDDAFDDALGTAAVAAAISVGRPGAAASMPTAAEIASLRLAP